LSLPVDAALFDMDGTLVDTEALMGEALRRTCAEAGLEVSRRQLDHFIGQAWPSVHRELSIGPRLGWDLPMLLTNVRRQAERLVGDGHPVRVLTGGVALVERLHDRGISIALVTGSMRAEAVATLTGLGILQRFSAVVTADDYEVGKPAPDCYLLAASMIETMPARCVVFEDSVHGVTAAQAAGMRVVATAEANRPLGQPGHQDLGSADRVVATLADVDDDLLTGLFPGASDDRSGAE
jgi:beta-phosphoglucomutase-like phosphatase (HAD superfamily)